MIIESTMGCCISKFFKKGPQIGEDHTFYRKFVNQTRDPAEVVLGNDGLHLDTKDTQPEMYNIENRNETVLIILMAT